MALQHACLLPFLPCWQRAEEESLNLSDLKSRLGVECRPSQTSLQPLVWRNILWGTSPFYWGPGRVATHPGFCVFSSPTSIKHVVVPVPVTDGPGA